MSSLLIKNGTVVTATDLFQGDVYIEGEKVAMIGADLDESADRVIDAHGCYLFPGGIDAHTHMQLPFMGTFASDTFESGTLASGVQYFDHVSAGLIDRRMGVLRVFRLAAAMGAGRATRQQRKVRCALGTAQGRHR